MTGPMTGRTLLAVAALGLVIWGCSAGAAGTITSTDAKAVEHEPGTVVDVTVSDGFTFTPAHVTVTVGTTVRWTNAGAIPHTITSGAGSRPADIPGALFDSKLPSGARIERTFTTIGDQPYFCRYHEGMGMVGMVTVTPSP